MHELSLTVLLWRSTVENVISFFWCLVSFENYVDDITVTVTGSNIKLSGSGYASLKSDIKEAYKVKEVSDKLKKSEERFELLKAHAEGKLNE